MAGKRAPKGFETHSGRIHPKGKWREGPVICPRSGRRMTRDEQFHAGVLYGGKRLTCPTCGTENVPAVEDPYVNTWAWGKHHRADQEVVNGKLVEKPILPKLEEGGPDGAEIPAW